MGGGVSTACSAVYLCVYLSDLCARQRPLLSNNPLFPPLTFPLITLTNRLLLLSYSRCQVTHGSALQPPNFRESDHALSNYWYRYQYSVSVSEVSVNYGIGLTLLFYVIIIALMEHIRFYVKRILKFTHVIFLFKSYSCLYLIASYILNTILFHNF